MGIEEKMVRNTLLVSSKDFFESMVEEGFEKVKVRPYPAVQSYLVNLLEFYLDAKNLHDEELNELGQRRPTTFAEMLLIANQLQSSEKIEILKKIGDRSLYISGFFSDSLNRKIIDIDYYISIGGTAYESLAECIKEDTTAQVYKVIAKGFFEYVEVFSYISQKSMIQNDQNILRLYDKYLKTGSNLAKEQLIEIGVLPVSQSLKKQSQQD